MSIARARAKLEGNEKQFRVSELKALIANHTADPNYRAALACWRRELLSLRDDSEMSSVEPERSWEEAKAHAIAQLKQNGRRILPKSVHEVRERYYAFLRQHSFLRG